MDIIKSNYNMKQKLPLTIQRMVVNITFVMKMKDNVNSKIAFVKIKTNSVIIVKNIALNQMKNKNKKSIHFPCLEVMQDMFQKTPKHTTILFFKINIKKLGFLYFLKI